MESLSYGVMQILTGVFISSKKYGHGFSFRNMFLAVLESFFPMLQAPKPACLRQSVFRLKREKERENMLLAGHTSVINFCSSFVSEYVWAHMLDYKAM